jgi:hypothetical protein
MGIKRKHIKALSIRGYSGFKPRHSKIAIPKRHEYFVVTNIAIAGDAPKDFIKYYHFGEGRKDKPQSWPSFIAKLGHKHFPVESITEHLITRLGNIFGFNMAKSELACLGGQIRFLSKYFIENPCTQVLEHGADLYAAYLNDREFVLEIENKHKALDFFTVQFTQDTLKHFFPEDYEVLMTEFLKLLVFDALIGNNDRHFYNWAVIRDIRNIVKPVFSPIYDSARGLFWNDSEDKILTLYNEKARLDAYILKYSEGSTPKIGWDGLSKINHFELLDKIKTLPIIINCETMKHVCSNDTLNSAFNMIDSEFKHLLSFERKALIKKCLAYRHQRIKKLLTFV